MVDYYPTLVQNIDKAPRRQAISFDTASRNSRFSSNMKDFLSFEYRQKGRDADPITERIPET